MSLRWGDIVAYTLGGKTFEATVQSVHHNGTYTIDIKGKRLRVPGNDLVLLEKAPKR